MIIDNERSEVYNKALERTRLTDKFAELTNELIAVKKRKALEWLKIRTTAKTNAEADRLWEATEDGLKEMEIELVLKAMSKSISSVRLEADAIMGEAKGQW